MAPAPAAPPPGRNLVRMLRCLLCCLLALPYPSLTAQDAAGWTVTATDTADYTGIALANGRIGLRTAAAPFTVQEIILNNVYDQDPVLEVSRIVHGMNFANLEVAIDGEVLTAANVTDWRQTLNLREAAFTTTLTFGDKARLSYTIYALRNLPYTGYVDVRVEPLRPLDLRVTAAIETPADFTDVRQEYQVLRDVETTMPILRSLGRTPTRGHRIATAGTFIWHHLNSSREDQRPELTHRVRAPRRNTLSFSTRLAAGTPYEFAWAGSEVTSVDFADPKSEAERMAIFNLLNSRDVLLAGHRAAWADLWRGDIIIEGNDRDQRDVRLALYHLYAFGRAGTDLSIAPMGLSLRTPYNGHIFWDTELWMFPPLLLLNPPIARSLVNYRVNRLAPARRRAENYGYRGAMFPWESDDTGEEATPPFALTGPFEHHITADVGIACWNFFRVTRDSSWLRQKGYPVLAAVADFWVSRATPNADGSYSINNVVGANEFAPNVDDNAFTNGAARTALDYASRAAAVLGRSPDPRWAAVAAGLRILRFPDGTTREHAAYAGEIIKQADANLLAYPLAEVTDRAAILRDLRYYEPKLSPAGPAMGKSVFAVIYARLGEPAEAYRLFRESFVPNQQPPFGAISEVATSNFSYFATGAGGLLQSVLFGFAGLRITDGGVEQRGAVLPAAWRSLTVTGVGPARETFTVRR